MKTKTLAVFLAATVATAVASQALTPKTLFYSATEPASPFLLPFVSQFPDASTFAAFFNPPVPSFFQTALTGQVLTIKPKKSIAQASVTTTVVAAPSATKSVIAVVPMSGLSGQSLSSISVPKTILVTPPTTSSQPVLSGL